METVSRYTAMLFENEKVLPLGQSDDIQALTACTLVAFEEKSSATDCQILDNISGDIKFTCKRH